MAGIERAGENGGKRKGGRKYRKEKERETMAGRQRAGNNGGTTYFLLLSNARIFHLLPHQINYGTMFVCHLYKNLGNMYFRSTIYIDHKYKKSRRAKLQKCHFSSNCRPKHPWPTWAAEFRPTNSRNTPFGPLTAETLVSTRRQPTACYYCNILNPRIILRITIKKIILKKNSYP